MKKRLLWLPLIMVMLVGWSGCNAAGMAFKDINMRLNGLESTINTYDEDSQIIDEVKGESVSFSSDSRFALKDSEGNTTEKSSVINLTVGGKQMIHVGSSLILRESTLKDRFRDFTQRVDIDNYDKSTPIIDRMVNDFKNLNSGDNSLILVRSQSGMPLAAFAGQSVSIFSTDIDKATVFLVDDQLLLIYRCDYTVYDMDLFN